MSGIFSVVHIILILSALISIIERRRNIGLMGQWFRAWAPTNPQQTCFVFEDDMEVSRHYYRYAYTALEKYYCDMPGKNKTSLQLRAHKKLLQAVRAEIGANAANDLTKGMGGLMWDNSSLDESLYLGTTENIGDYTKMHAGLPVMYGICLQNQHLHTMRHMSKLEIRSSNSNFLYSLIGSWGPLLMPIAWQAFLDWWSYHCPEVLELSDEGMNRYICCSIHAYINLDNGQLTVMLTQLQLFLSVSNSCIA